MEEGFSFGGKMTLIILYTVFMLVIWTRIAAELVKLHKEVKKLQQTWDRIASQMNRNIRTFRN